MYSLFSGSFSFSFSLAFEVAGAGPPLALDLNPSPPFPLPESVPDVLALPFAPAAPSFSILSISLNRFLADAIVPDSEEDDDDAMRMDFSQNRFAEGRLPFWKWFRASLRQRDDSSSSMGKTTMLQKTLLTGQTLGKGRSREKWPVILSGRSSFNFERETLLGARC